MVIGRISGTSSSVLVPSSFFFSTPTFTFAKEGMYFETGSSSLIFSSWINCIATTEVIALVSDEAEDGLVGDRRLGHHVLHAEGFVIDLLAALPDQDVRAGNLAGRHLILEELGDLLKLGLIEVRSSGNIESAFRAGR